ncbi:MAG: hypothetical protein RLZZ91_807 [Bacteroidota bacterium]|jgi:hypothetical protein
METNNTKLETGLKIHTFRDTQVMLDKDLAILYGVQTKRLIQQVKRNIDRFPDSFMFQLNDDEISRSQFATLNSSINSGTSETISSSRSQFATLNSKQGKNIKYRPYAFTEQGVAMLSSILRTSTAVQTSIFIMESFVSMRKMLTSNNDFSNEIGLLKTKILDHDSKINKLLNRMEDQSFPQSGIFFNDQIFDAYVFSSELIAKARKSLILIDNYIDETTLIQLSKRNQKVSCTIYTERITEQLKLDIEKHNAQYSPIEIRILKNAHDRFIILDHKELYHLGASLKDLGKRWFAFSRMDSLTNQILSQLKM